MRWILLFCLNFIVVHFFVMLLLSDVQSSKGISNLVNIKYKSTKDDVIDLIGYPSEIDYQNNSWRYQFSQGYTFEIQWQHSKVISSKLWPDKFKENKIRTPIVRISSMN